jgi:putative tricarboxylic transport membrane protein
MTDETANESGGTGPSHRSVEIGVALAMALLAVIGVIGSLQAGIGWAAEGPQAGFFPFYISVIVLISCAINLAGILGDTADHAVFATWGQLRQVLAVVIPTTAYVFLVPVLGMYVSSGLLIAVFMKWLGRYSWLPVLLVSVGVPVLTYVMFEKWFLVPLPKGPLEDWLGL